MNRLFDKLMSAGRDLPPGARLALLALLIALIVLAFFRWTANRTLTDRRKDRMMAALMEFHLFRADPLAALAAFPRLLAAQGLYLRSLLLPFLLSLAPVAWLIVQSQYWLLVRPFQPGETVLCKITLNRPANRLLETPFRLFLGSDETPVGIPVRIPDEQAIYWSFILPDDPALHTFRLRGEGREWTLPLAHSNPWQPVVSRWTARGWTHSLSQPRGAILKPDSPLRSVELRYPPRLWRFAGIEWDGVILLMIAAFAAAGLLKAGHAIGPWKR